MKTILRILTIATAAFSAAVSLPARSASPLPLPPTDLVAAPISATRIDLVWNYLGEEELAFVVERRHSGSDAWTVVWGNPNAIFPLFNDMGLSPGTCFEYRVKARTLDGRQSEPSNVVTVETPATIPLYNDLLRDRQSYASSFQHRKVVPYRAVDGTQWTRWLTARTVENVPREDWLSVDMGLRQTFDKVRIIWQRNLWALKYEIHVSDDGSDWKTVVEVDRSDVRTIDDLTFPPVTGRYVRFYGIESARKTMSWDLYGGYSIYQFQAYAPGVDPDPLEWESSAFMKTATATVRPEAAQFAVDSHLGTFWGTGPRPNGDEHSITVDLGDEQDIYEISPFWHVPAETYQIRLSSDGASWRTVAEPGSVQVTPVVNEELKEIHTKSFVSPERARYVRVVISGKAIHPRPDFTSILLQELLVHSVPPGAPRAPEGLRAATCCSQRVSLQWEDASADETGFEIHRRELGTSQWVLVTTVAGNITCYEAGPVSPGQAFVYRVRAVNDHGPSLFTNDARPGDQASETENLL